MIYSDIIYYTYSYYRLYMFRGHRHDQEVQSARSAALTLLANKSDKGSQYI